MKRRSHAVPLLAYLELVNTDAGRAQLSAVLEARPFPHFEPAETPGLLVKIDEDGKRTIGRFVNREFQDFLRQNFTIQSIPAHASSFFCKSRKESCEVVQ
jgi:hypothetical protein